MLSSEDGNKEMHFCTLPSNGHKHSVGASHVRVKWGLTFLGSLDGQLFPEIPLNF